MKKDMKKDILALMVALAGGLALPSPCSAQNLAPDNLANRIFTVSITAGSAPFSSTGTYQLATAPVGNDFVVLGPAGAGFAFGTYNYSQTGANTGVATFVDAQAGAGVAAQLVFASASAGSLSLTNARTAGFQTAAFSVAAYVSWSPPAFFSSGYTNGQFQAYLSGQPGWTYSLEASTNLSSWIPAATLTAPDLTTLFTDTNVAGAGARFYRVKVAGTAFAPASLAGQTLNVTIDSGAAPLATNGIYQWMAADSNETYQVLGGPGTTDGAGAYSYLKSGANSGLISWTDAQSGISVSQQLLFNSPASGFYYGTNSTGFQAGRFTMATGAVLFLGNLRFVPDTARAASLYFPADGSTGSLSVTNANGYVWTLSLPADALLTPQTITMTPFASVDTSQSALPITTGVLLEPDGTQFSDAVTLTLTTPSQLGAHASLMLAGQDGSDLYFVTTTNQANSYSTALFHFTSAAVSDATDAQWESLAQSLLGRAKNAYDQAVSDIKALERPVVQPPEPPDYEPKCDPNDPEPAQAEQAANDYEKALFAKERDAIGRLLSAARALTLLGDGTYADGALRLARELVETSGYRTVDALFASYSGDPKKFYAVTKVALSLERDDVLLGGGGRPDWDSQIRSWILRVRDYYFDKLRNQHDYSMLGVLFGIQRDAVLLGADSGADDQFFNDLRKALTFKLTLDISYTVSGTCPQSESVEAKGDLTLATTNVYLGYLQGSGPIDYLSGSRCYDAVLAPGQSFSDDVFLMLNACTKNPTALFSLVAYGAYENGGEVWQGGGQVSSDMVLAEGCSTVFGDNGYTGAYPFEVPLNNGQAEAVSATIDASDPPPLLPAEAKLTFILEHTPQ